ncbi:MAG: Rrf2 family transcriptional regulator [Candidatus Omnitrophota bacterium]
MKIPTRVRYGTRLMLDLALNYGQGALFLKDIAEREEISEKYLSQIIIPLRTAGLVNSFRGAQGGYALAKLPSQITVKDIVEILEGGLDLLESVKDPAIYNKVSICVTHELWNKVSKRIAETLAAMTLEDLVKEYQGKEGKTLLYNI